MAPRKPLHGRDGTLLPEVPLTGPARLQVADLFQHCPYARLLQGEAGKHPSLLAEPWVTLWVSPQTAPVQGGGLAGYQGQEKGGHGTPARPAAHATTL